MRYLFLTAPGLSSGLEAPAHEYAELFRRHGREVELLHIADGDFIPRLQAMLDRRPPDLALSFGGFADALQLSGPGATPQNLWGQARIPFFKLIGDVHAYMPQHHHVRSSFQLLTYVMKDHAVLRARYEHPRLGERAAMINWLPPLLPVPPDAAPQPITERVVYFHKNGNPSAALEQHWQGLTRPLRNALFEIGHAMRDDIDRAFVLRIADAVERYIAEVEPDRLILAPYRDFLLAQIDDYVRRLKGELIVRKLKDLPVVVNGRHWEGLQAELGACRLRVITTADHNDTSRRIKSSLGTINIGPNAELMIQERSARAIAFGHGLVEYETQFARDNGFPHTFRLADDSLPAVVDRLLHDPAAADEFAGFRAAFIAKYPILAAMEYFEDCAALVHTANSRPTDLPNYIWWPPPP